MNQQTDLYGQIRQAVHEETKWLKHYVGKVMDTNDPSGIGRVLVAIIELGWTDASLSLWASPRQANELKVPTVDSWVEIYFIMGDSSRPVYLPGAVEHMLTTPQIKRYSDPSTQVLFEDPNDHNFIEYTESNKSFNVSDLVKMNIASGEVTIGEGSEAFLKGTSWNTYFSALIISINTLLGSKLDGTGTPGTLLPPTDILSLSIKGE